MTDTDVAFLLYYRPCPYNRHDLYLPSISASLLTLGRFECAVASALAPHGLRIISPLTLTLNFSEPSGRLQKIGSEFFLPSVHRRFGLCPCATTLISSSSPSSRCPPEHYLPTNLGPPPGERVPRHSRERAGMGESIGARHPPQLARGQEKDEECRSERGDARRRTHTHRTLDASSSWLSMNLSLSLSLSLGEH